MNRAETANLLSVIKGVDNRTVDDATAQIWHKLLMDIPFRDAAEAVRRHFSESTDYLMPVHVLRGAQAVMAERAALARAAHPELAAAEALSSHPFDDGRQRGPKLVRHVLARLGEARQQMGGRLGRDLAGELLERFMVEALERYPLLVRPTEVRGAHCGKAGCQCSHSDGCDAGWVEVPPDEVPDPVLFGEQDRPPPSQAGQVRPCPNCRQAMAEMIAAASSRRSAMAILRSRRGVGRR